MPLHHHHHHHHRFVIMEMSLDGTNFIIIMAHSQYCLRLCHNSASGGFSYPDPLILGTRFLSTFTSIVMAAVLRSRLFYGRLRLRTPEIPEPTPAPAAGKKCFLRLIRNHICLFKSNWFMFITRTRLFYFAFLKRTSRSRLAKAASAQ